MENNPQILAQAIFPAPYRVELLGNLSNHFNLTCLFDRDYDKNRNSNWFQKSSLLRSYIYSASADEAKQVKRTLKRIRDNSLVLLYDPFTRLGIYVMLLCIYNRIPYVVNCDGAIIKKSLIKGIVKSFFIKRASLCFANGYSAMSYFMIYGSSIEKIRIHHFSSLHTSDIQNRILSQSEKEKIKLSLNLDPNIPIVLCIGQFAKRKGIDILLKSTSYVQYPCEFIIIGGGELKDEYNEYIKQAKLRNVRILDFISPNELGYYYKASDIFVLPTREDIWGLVVNEAMAYGLPIITTTKCMAGVELIDDGVNGYIVNVNDYLALAKKMDLLLSNPQKRFSMGSLNISKISEYTIEKMSETHIRSIYNILEKRDEND